MNQFISDKGSQEYLAFIKRLERTILAQKCNLESKWYKISSMLAGKQYFKENEYGRLIEDDAPSYRIRYRANRMLSILLRDIARVTSGIPIADVMPASDSRRDKSIAKVTDAVLRYNWQPGVQDIEYKTKEMVNWAARTGIGLLKVEWDKHLGAPIYIYKKEKKYRNEIMQNETGAPILDLNGMPLLESVPERDEDGNEIENPILDKNGNPILDKVLYRGDLKVSVIPPTDFFVLRRYDDLQDSPVCAHYYLMRVEDVRERWSGTNDIYPKKAIPEVKRLSELIKSVYFDIDSDTDHGNGFYRRTGGEYREDLALDENDEGLVLVWEIWRKPTRKMPEGEYLVACEDKILHKGKNIYKHKLYPFVDYKEIPWSGQYWPMSTQEFLISPQKSYLRSRSQEIEDANLTSNPVLITYPASKTNKNHQHNRPGGTIDVFMKGYEPKYLQRNPSNIMQYKNIQMSALQDLDEISAQHEVSRGEAPGRLDSSLALSWLSQKDEQGVMPKIANLNRTREKLCFMMASVQSQFVTEERIARIVGQSSEVEVVKFTGQDMAGDDPNKNYFDIRIRPSSTRPLNKAGQKNEILSLLQYGVYDPRKDRRRILLAFEEGDVHEVYQEERLDRARAKKEIEIMKSGSEVPIRQYENHQIHYEEHTLYMKTDEFYNLPEERQQVYFKHLGLHQQAIEQEMQQQMMQMMMMQQNMNPQSNKNGKQKIVSEGQQSNQKRQDLNALYGAGG